MGILDEEREELLRDDESLLDPQSNLSTPNPDKRTYFARIWRGFDTKYMKPMLTSSQPTLMETLPIFCAPLARCFTSDDQRLDGHQSNCGGVEGPASRFYDPHQQPQQQVGGEESPNRGFMVSNSNGD